MPQRADPCLIRIERPVLLTCAYSPRVANASAAFAAPDDLGAWRARRSATARSVEASSSSDRALPGAAREPLGRLGGAVDAVMTRDCVKVRAWRPSRGRRRAVELVEADVDVDRGGGPPARSTASTHRPRSPPRATLAAERGAQSARATRARAHLGELAHGEPRAERERRQRVERGGVEEVLAVRRAR